LTGRQQNRQKSQPFAKLKELYANTFAPHLILPQHTPAHPPPKQLTSEFSLDIVNNPCKKKLTLQTEIEILK